MATPGESIVAMAKLTHNTTDRDGRRISVRQLNALDRLRLFKAVGSALVENSAYFGVAYLAASVTAIDDAPIPWPTCEAHIEALVGRLGDAGLDAVSDILSLSPRATVDSDVAGN